MSFQFPFFLLALLAILLPVLVHLFNFRGTKRVAFTNVRFLQEVKRQKQEGTKIKNRLVLASRMLAVLFLVLSFAQPYIPSKSGTVLQGKKNVLLYVDNSQSMSGLGSEGTLLDQAIQKSREIADDFGLNDRFMLLTNDFSGTHRRWVDKKEFNNLVDGLQLTANSRHFSEIQLRIEQIFSSIPKENNHVFILSDFQKSFITTDSLSMNTSLRFHVMPLATQGFANVAIDSAWFAVPLVAAGDMGELLVRLSNHSDKDAIKIPVKLFIDGKQKTMGNSTLPARSTGTDTLLFRTDGKGWHAGELRLNDHPITFDNQFYFSYRTADDINILLINNIDTISYLNYLFKDDKLIHLSVNQKSAIDFGQLASSNLVILNSLERLSSGLIVQLEKYVESGGSLAVIPSLDVDISEYNKLLGALKTDVFTGISNQPNRVSKLNLGHAIFSGVFENMPQNPDMPGAKTYFTLSNQSHTRKRPIMTMRGGDEMLSEYISGKGHVFLFTVPLQARYSNLPLHALFVPLMYRMALLSSNSGPLYYTIGKDKSIPMHGMKTSTAQAYHLKAENFDVIPDLRNKNGMATFYLADQIKQAGNYVLQLDGKQQALLSFNRGRDESDLSYLTSKELEGLFADYDVNIMDEKAQLSENFNVKATFGTQLWKYCLILALVFMAAEILLIRTWPKVNT